MSPTVHALRNEIRVSAGRYEREVSSGFTKEALAAVCDAVDADVDTDRRLPKDEMRAAIRRRLDDLDPSVEDDRAFRKAELQRIASALRGE